MTFDVEDLKPLVAVCLDQLRAEQPVLPERLAFCESEAAALLGTHKHVLRDARLRGEISGRLIGKRIHYTRQELLRFLNSK